MDTRNSPKQAADDYVAAVRTLFQPAGATAGERGAAGPASYASLVAQAQQLAPLSHQLTLTTAQNLEHVEDAVRMQAELQLLAKALTDLDVGEFLLQAAADEELGIVRPAAATGEPELRGLCLDGEREYRFALLLGAAAPGERRVERSAANIATVPEARAALKVAIGDTLALVTDRAAASTGAALAGLSTLGMAEILGAAGALGMGAAAAIGQAESLAKLYGLAQAFVARAYASLLALLGPQIAAIAGEQVLGWLEELQAGEQIEALVERFYGTERTNEELVRLVDTSAVALPGYLHVLERIGDLDSAFHQQTSFVAKILPKLKFVPLLPAAQQPVCLVLLAGCYLVLAAYVVFTGADFLDSANLAWLDRVEGLRHYVFGELPEA